MVRRKYFFMLKSYEMTNESHKNQAELAKFEAMRKLVMAASELGEPISGSLALKLHTGKSIYDALKEAGDIDVVLTDQSKIDQLYELGLEDVPCNSPGWKARVTEKSFKIGSKDIELKLIALRDIITSMTQMWVSGRLRNVQSLHVEKLTRQISFLIVARDFALNQSDQDSVDFIGRSLGELLQWTDCIEFEDMGSKEELQGLINKALQ